MTQQQRFQRLIDSPLIGAKDSIQYIQTLHRQQLIEFWNIEEGQTILEIGCGQGDTTAVLASYVGESGKVIAIDRNTADYGAPMTLAEATKRISRTELGRSISFHFEVDLLKDDLSFLDAYRIDAVVIAHASWYFEDEFVLVKMLEKLKPLTSRFLFAEWHMQVRTVNQMPHWLSAMLQAEYHLWVPENEHNIRTLYTAEKVKEVITHVGGKVDKTEVLINGDLQDGEWEVDFTVDHFKTVFSQYSNIPVKQKQLWSIYIQTIEALIKTQKIKPLDIFVCVAAI